jgi:two-component system, response regulator PdtaR
MKKTSALIVEDEMITAIFLRHLLEEEGCDVIDVLATGEEVMERIGVRKPDVIVMDIMLAGEMDGIETAIQVRQRHDIPILFVSASTDQGSISRALATKPMGYLPKPVEAWKLRNSILSFIRNKEECRVPADGRVIYNI